ncbi:2-dehydro-3-deoxygluconokinase [Latilactobacillus sakei]|nr:sugar kinase [Latilactobacillus sakei]AUX11688.1 2-dehydro-3-deoxygluconokinase [Latilactobacillus sakei]
MTKSFLTIGEPMAVFSADEPDVSLEAAKHFTRYIAGAELNVAIGLARLKHQATYLTALGEDPFGVSIKQEIKDNQIDTQYIETMPDYWTGFYLKQRVTTGDPAVYFYRKNSAAAHFNQQIIDQVDFSQVGLIHLSGIMAGISENGLVAVQKLFEKAQANQITTTFDPNIRKPLWSSEEKMITTLNALAKEATIILPGINEGELLMGSRDPKAIADFYLNRSDITQTVIVKLGPAGAYIQTKAGESITVSGYHVAHVVDTVGAGDGFAVGLISGLLEGLSLPDAAKRACAIGALAVQSAGDSEGYPTNDQLKQFMEAQK